MTTSETRSATSVFGALREQLADAAAAFAGDPGAAGDILAGMVDDVDRALSERLEIFPVCHHSPASGLAMVRRLREKQPTVIYMELCEDLRPLLDELRNCRLPVALQAFASAVDGFPASWAPLSIVAPITESSAEYQAIAYALDTPGVELVLVDRSTDHVFQWSPTEDEATADADTPESDNGLHGEAVGIDIGDMRPRFAELEQYLLHHGKVRHWSEWWDQYVEQPLADADYDTYRQVMVMIGSLFRRLRRGSTEVDENRERYMWTRMREHLAATGADPDRALYICGAAHAASRVEQFGLDSTAPYEISPRTATTWHYGLIPSSHSAIEEQFGLAGGAVSIAAATWAKGLRRAKTQAFRLTGQPGSRGRAAKKALPVATPAAAVADHLSGFLTSAPALDPLDESELLEWSVDIVRLARRNGYLASTADAIAIFEHAILLAGLRNRTRPTPYDFQDAAITCIEKDTVPGRRDVRRLCEILLGGDRIGQVGYSALPPLARDVLDRLAPLGLDLSKRTLQRALLDLRADPHLRPCSDLLWLLRKLIPADAVRPIMGSRGLGEQAVQESWDLGLGKYQRSLVELGYEGVTVEQVFEQRLRRAVDDPDATAAAALAAVEDALVYLGSARLADEIGSRAVELLAAERTVDDAPAVLRRIRLLLNHFRSSGAGMPEWCERFVTAGYAHYCTLLPTAFAADDTGAGQVAAMLGFLFGMESLALSLGCDHTQLELAVLQSHPEAPDKVALLWAARFQLGLLPLAELRERCDDMLVNPLVLPSFPRYLTGFVHAIDPAPALQPFVVELLSKAFGRLPDRVLLPWLPTLITTLRKQVGEVMPALVREAGRTFPGALPAVDGWVPPWSETAATPNAPLTSAPRGPATDLLAAHPAACDALAVLFGHDPVWEEPPAAADTAVADLLDRYPATATALAANLGID
ncbi:DUF5682 family protein [Nocardia otitidiscaviarum]|uniref:DUF5682 family protein n=1 Tax=Nocardia otitidiscaviarum TaxID=1823 RepID=UPI0018940128|nr:DUF5682 family protein [Nocardia otitidiscaviarum]MBF6178629.1 hypothetical protein [Nocardia otitidiscaviarum]